MRHGDYVALDPSEVKHMDEGAKAVRPDRGAKARQIVEAWLKIAEHPFFASCYHTDEPLLDSMLAKLSATTAECDLLRRQHQGQADIIVALRTRVAQVDARLAAVEALADVRNGTVHADNRDPEGVIRVSDLRAVLSAAPTTTPDLETP